MQTPFEKKLANVLEIARNLAYTVQHTDLFTDAREYQPVVKELRQDAGRLLKLLGTPLND